MVPCERQLKSSENLKNKTKNYVRGPIQKCIRLKLTNFYPDTKHHLELIHLTWNYID